MYQFDTWFCIIFYKIVMKTHRVPIILDCVVAVVYHTISKGVFTIYRKILIDFTKNSQILQVYLQSKYLSIGLIKHDLTKFLGI